MQETEMICLVQVQEIEQDMVVTKKIYKLFNNQLFY